MGSEISAWGVKGKAGREAREEAGGRTEGGRRRWGWGVSQHAAPLGRRAMTSEALPSSYSP